MPVGPSVRRRWPRPDGYPILMVPRSHFIYPKLPSNTEQHFTPISLVESAPILLAVHPRVPVTSMKELVGLA